MTASTASTEAGNGVSRLLVLKANRSQSTPSRRINGFEIWSDSTKVAELVTSLKIPTVLLPRSTEPLPMKAPSVENWEENLDKVLVSEVPELPAADNVGEVARFWASAVYPPTLRPVSPISIKSWRP